MSGKVLYVKLFRMRPSLFKTKAWGWAIWTAINAVTWVLAAILAMILPFFSSFLGVEGEQVERCGGGWQHDWTAS